MLEILKLFPRQALIIGEVLTQSNTTFCQHQLLNPTVRIMKRAHSSTSSPSSSATSRQTEHSQAHSASPARPSKARKISGTHMSHKPLEYTPLSRSKNEIRLLRIQSCRSADPASEGLECTLFHASLDNAPKYKALSYAWGHLMDEQPVIVNGQVLFVTQNLSNALKNLRNDISRRKKKKKHHETEEKGISKDEDGMALWIDAICINQQDILERSHQTGKMRGIYMCAESVTVWLGTDYWNCSKAMQLARELSTCDGPEIRAILHDPSRSHLLDAMVTLFRRQYWWRIWVIQEVAVAKSVTVHCGAESISWAALDVMCDIMRSEEMFLESHYYNKLGYVRTLTHGGPRGLKLSRFSSNIKEPPLLELLTSHKSKKSTDPKDKVYALVGISDARKDFGAIDYSQSVRQIYTHTARHIISKSRKLDVICVKQHDRNQFGLPSWSPNWTRLPPHSVSAAIGLHSSERNFAAAADSLADAQFLMEGYVLRVTGVVIDTISNVAKALKRTGPMSDSVPVMAALRDWWACFVAAKGDSVSEHGAFLRTITCGEWMFDDQELYSRRLKTISTYSETSPENILRISSLEDVRSDVEDEKRQLATLLSAALMMNRRRLLLSTSNYVGLAPWNTEEGDIIAVLHGCRFPVILRRREDHFVLVGEAYLDGFMFGEALNDRGRMYEATTFEIH